MRPATLIIEGLRSFRAPVTIDFTGRDHIAVVGDTGAGKSSILEAITYALYGKTSFSAQANQELMNDTSTKLRVVLCFRVSGEEWEVARTLRRDGRGAVKPSGAQLRRLGTGGETVERIEKVAPVNERITRLVGLDCDAFLRTVVLPQGRFARLLVEDRPGKRSEILRQVWRTDELEAMGILAAGAHRDVLRLKDRVEAKYAASNYPEDPAAYLEQLNGAAEDARRQAAVASATKKHAVVARDNLRAAEKAHGTASAVTVRLRPAAIERAAERLAPIREIVRRIDEEDASLRQREAGIKDTLSCIRFDDGPTPAEVAESLTRLNDIGMLARKAVEAADRLRKSANTALEKRTEAERAAEAEAEAAEKAKRHSKGRPALAEAVESARARRSSVERQHGECGDLKDNLANAKERLAARRKRTFDFSTQLDAARQKERRLAAAAAKAEERLSAARRTESAAAAAHDLLPGDECPVCLRDLPADWTPPADSGLRKAEMAAKTGLRAAEEAGKRVAGLTAQLQGANRELREAEKTAAAASTVFGAALAALRKELHIDPDAPLPHLDSLLQPLNAALKQASDTIARHDHKHVVLIAESTRRAKAAAQAKEAASGTDKLAGSEKRAAISAVKQVNDTIRMIPLPYRPTLELPDDPAQLRAVNTATVGGRIVAAKERRDILAYRESERDRLRGELDQTGKDRADLARRRAAEADQPLRDIVADLNDHRDTLMSAIRDLDLDTGPPGAVSGANARELKSRIEELRATTADVLHAADEGEKKAAASANAASATLAEIARHLGRDRDADDADAVASAAGTAAEDARFRARHAADSAEAFAEVITDVQSLRAILADATELEQALGDLDAALKPGAFLKWLTLRRSRDLLVHASRMLGEMTGGKYAFADPGDTVEWRVLDCDSGQPRSPASLSGGEQFIASLALALGMVEMMARSGGRLESLFLDEGFGSLDRNNLDAAVEALGTVAAGGRMVGVISHVRAVAEQIDHVLAVTRGTAGSRAVWLSNAQRRRLSQSDANWEVSAAVGGLLE